MTQAPLAEPSRGKILILAAACGIVVANIYISQPLVGEIGRGVRLSARAASLIAAYFGWRAVFFTSAGTMALTCLVLAFALPRRQPQESQNYAALLASALALPARFAILRQRAAYQAAAFAGFSLFWTGAPLLLEQHFGFTQRGIAAFALVGAAGALVAPLAGRLGDRGLAGPATLGALLGTMLSFLLAAAGGRLHSVVLLAAAGVLLDGCVQCNLVIGQREIYTLAPELRGRLNGVFIAIFFAGGAAGSALTSPLLLRAGWNGICLAGMVFCAAALAYFAASAAFLKKSSKKLF